MCPRPAQFPPDEVSELKVVRSEGSPLQGRFLHIKKNEYSRYLILVTTQPNFALSCFALKIDFAHLLKKYRALNSIKVEDWIGNNLGDPNM